MDDLGRSRYRLYSSTSLEVLDILLKPQVELGRTKKAPVLDSLYVCLVSHPSEEAKILTPNSSRPRLPVCRRASGLVRSWTVSSTSVEKSNLNSDAPSRKHFGQTNRPYSLTIAGKTYYVLVDAQDFSTVDRDAATFTFTPLVPQVCRAFQLPEAAIRKLYGSPSSSLSGTTSEGPTSKLAEKEKRAVNIGHQMIVVGMRGKQTHSHANKVARQLEKMVNLESICSRFSTVRDRDESSTVVSLHKLCSIMVIAAGQASYFGDALFEIDPTLPETFAEFDKLCWQIFCRPSMFWSKELTKGKIKLLQALETYARKPMEERSDMPPFFQKWEMECRRVGLGNSEIAIVMLIQYFG